MYYIHEGRDNEGEYPLGKIERFYSDDETGVCASSVIVGKLLREKEDCERKRQEEEEDGRKRLE